MLQQEGVNRYARAITIRELVNLIAELTGYEGKIVWNTSNPDGQPRRCLENSRAGKESGFEAKTDFVEGLKRTIDWQLSKLERRTELRPEDPLNPIADVDLFGS